MGEHVMIETRRSRTSGGRTTSSTARRTSRRRSRPRQPTSDAQARGRALRFAIEGVRNHPERLPEKIAARSGTSCDPRACRTCCASSARSSRGVHAVTLQLDDALPMLVAVPLFASS
jgi:hypothetical protein